MKSSTKLLVLGNVCLLALAGWLFFREHYPARIYKALTKQETIPEASTDVFHRNELFNAMPADTNALVFLGNSLTQYFELAEFFPGTTVKNRGIAGDLTGDVLKRLDAIVKDQPKKIFIEIGINDVFDGIPEDTILERYGRIVNTLAKACPKTHLYVQSLFPVSNHHDMLRQYDTKSINHTVESINKKLQSFVSEKNTDAMLMNRIHYLDTYNPFNEDGLRKEYTIDGVHLSAQGYVLWAAILKPFVEE
jgi:lysophospholipase L1-like esterase